jgi:hypothetical protein
MKLIDTDIIIDHFHGHQPALDYIAAQFANGETLAISVVTITEILSGMRDGEQTRTERLLLLFSVLDVNEEIARLAGYYLGRYRRSHGAELGDALIAATARHSGAGIVTRNRKHYPMSDVTVVVPYERGV